MGQKIFLRMWCRVNFYCTERVIYHVNTMKKKELIFYMMHEMRIVWYLQLGICLFFFLSPVFFFLKKRNHEWFSDWTVRTFLLCVCLRSRQSCCCLMCHSLFDPWPRKMSYYQKKKYIVWIYFAFPSEMYKKTKTNASLASCWLKLFRHFFSEPQLCWCC